MANVDLPASARARTVRVGSDEQLRSDQDVIATGVVVLDGPVADLAVNADGQALVATHYGRDAVSILDPASLAAEVVAPLSGDPFTAAVTRDHAYVSTISLRNDDAVEVVELSSGTVVTAYPQDGTVTALATSQDGKRVFVGRTETDRVDIAVIDTITGEVDTIDAGWGPAINIDALHVVDNGRQLLAAVSGERSSHLVIVNVESARIDGAVGIGAPIRDLAVGPDHTAYLLTSDRFRGGSVAVVDLYRGQIRERIDIGGAPTQLVLAEDGTRAYIVDHDSVAVLCTATKQIVHTIDTGVAPSCVAVSPDGAQLFIADYTGQVTAFAVAATSSLYSQLLPANPGRARRMPAEVA